MTRNRILQLLCAGLLGLMYAGAPAHAFDPARGVRESITQSVRDDVRRHIRAREHRYRNSRAEFRHNTGEARKIRIRKGTVPRRAP